jgi:N utilization substance protein B
MKRTEQREWVFKLIFENQLDDEESLLSTLENHQLDIDKESFLYKSLIKYMENRSEIENILLEELGENPYKRLSKIDKAILSVSINEMKFLDIPESVSINEAVNLSKKYSTENGYKFINSVLGSLVRKGK